MKVLLVAKYCMPRIISAKGFIVLLTVFMIEIVSSCVVNTAVKDFDVPVLDVEGNCDAAVSEPLTVSDYSYVQLDGENDDAFFRNGKILDVVGDTIVILEDDFVKSRIIMFDVNDGRYLGQVSHQGQAPGEYRIISGAFVDAETQEVLLPDFDKPIVNVYSLRSGDLSRTIKRDSVEYRTDPVGSLESCVNIAQMAPDGLKILQYGREFERMDSIEIKGFKGGEFSTIWDNAGNGGVIMVSDTLYAIKPGRLQSVAVLSGGKYFMTPDQEREVMDRIINSDESEMEILKPYIIIRNVQFSDDALLLTTMHDNSKTSDLYDLRDGKLMYRFKYADLSKPNSVMLRGQDGKEISVERIYIKDGEWFGFVNEGYASELSGTDSGSTNCAVVRWRII